MLLHAFWCFFFTSDKKRARFYCGCWDANTQQERLVHKKFDWLKKSLLIKNLQFLSKNFETWSKWPNHEMVKWTKFQWIWAKIVEFLLMINFRASRIFLMHQSLEMLFLHFSTYTVTTTTSCSYTVTPLSSGNEFYFDPTILQCTNDYTFFKILSSILPNNNTAPCFLFTKD